MIRRAVCAWLGLALMSWPTETASTRTPVHYPNVVQIVCAGGKGSGFNTTRGWVSVAHVTTQFGCSINGQPIGADSNTNLDFSRVQYDGNAPAFPINCEGFKTGTYVWAAGYAGGFEWQTLTRHYVTYKSTSDGYRVLLGEPHFIPGMSGGPVLNERGEVVGLVNMYSKIYPVSFSRDIKDTELCKS